MFIWIYIYIIYIYIYIYIYSQLAIPYWLFPIGYSYAYSHLPKSMQWAAPWLPPMCWAL